MEKVQSEQHVTYLNHVRMDRWEGGKTDVGTGGGNVLTGPGILSL